jgi:hypothetical protein
MKTYFELREELNEGKLGKAIGTGIGRAVGGLGGAIAGGTAGGFIAPGIGNMAGFAAGGLVGGSAGGNIGGKIGDFITGNKARTNAINATGRGIKKVAKSVGRAGIEAMKPTPPSSVVHPDHGKVMTTSTGKKVLRGVDGKATTISHNHPDFKQHAAIIKNAAKRATQNWRTQQKAQKRAAAPAVRRQAVRNIYKNAYAAVTGRPAP